jgi:hypothetical protein
MFAVESSLSAGVAQQPSFVCFITADLFISPFFRFFFAETKIGAELPPHCPAISSGEGAGHAKRPTTQR